MRRNRLNPRRTGPLSVVHLQIEFTPLSEKNGRGEFFRSQRFVHRPPLESLLIIEVGE